MQKSIKQYLAFDQTVRHLAKVFPPERTKFTSIPPQLHRNKELKPLRSDYMLSF